MTTWWDENGTEAFYRKIFDGRPQTHAAFRAWVHGLGLPHPRRILEVGSGASIFYAPYFAHDHYTGVDISSQAIAWNRAHALAGHKYIEGDVVRLEGGTGLFDVVFSLAVVDHVPDIPAFVKACADRVRPGGWLYLNSYRGWHPDLADHRYSLGNEDHCYYNDLSPDRLGQQLRDLGFTGEVSQGVDCEGGLGPECLAIFRR